MFGAGREGPYELLYRVDDWDGAPGDVVDVMEFIESLGTNFTPTCFILSRNVDAQDTYVDFKHVPKAQPNGHPVTVTLIPNIIHPGAIKRFFKAGTTASAVFIGGFPA